MSVYIQQPASGVFTREQMLTRARAWMVNTFGAPRDLESQLERENWYSKHGMLCDFISDHFPQADGTQ